MKKTIALVLVFGLLVASSWAAVNPKHTKPKRPPSEKKQKISPTFASQFGKVLTVEGAFVKKARTYHDQNIVKEPYKLKVFTVDGKALKRPVVIEYSLAEKQQPESGVTYRMRAYETLYAFGTPEGWSKTPQQFNYQLHYKLIVKGLQKVSSKAIRRLER